MPNFDQLGLNQEILSTINKLGFITPTEVQSKVIPMVLETDQHLIVLSQTGSGKTATFGLPMIQSFDPNEKKVQYLILAPTRELVQQICQELKDYSINSRGFKVISLFGGGDIRKQIDALATHPAVVVGTPGRTLDFLNRRRLNLSSIKSLILDEADQMLDMGFQEELEEILSFTNPEKRVLLFSATMNKQVERLASNKYLENPIKVTIGKQNQGVMNVQHYYHLCSGKQKTAVLSRILDNFAGIYGIVFCKTKKDTVDICLNLQKMGYRVEAFNGDMSQPQRELVMKKFRSKNLKLLIATDVAARGIDVKNLTHIINYALPDDSEIYVHRSGRTGRAGKQGICISIVGQKEKRKIVTIQKMLGLPIEFQRIPTGDEVCQNRLLELSKTFEDFQVDEQLDEFAQAAYLEFSRFSKEELIKSFVGLQLSKLWRHYHKLPDLNAAPKVRFSKIKINLGQRDDFQKADLFALIKSVQRNVEIGKINIYDKKTELEVDKKVVQKMIEKLNTKSFAHLPIKVTPLSSRGQFSNKTKRKSRKKY